MERISDMLIIGGGPGGYTAALYAAQAGLSVTVLEKLCPGGQMAQAARIGNYPGFGTGISGFDLGEKMRRDAELSGAGTKLAEALRAELSGKIKTVETREGVLLGRTVVLATGAGPQTLELPNETALLGRGLSYCAACDGMFFREKTVVVVGGGNTAAADALHLARICRKVIVVHRRDTLRAARISIDALARAENVEFIWNSTVAALLGSDRVTGVTVKHVLTGGETQIPCDGVFVCIGRKPASELARGQLALDDSGYVLAGESTRTSLPGVYAVGDVRAKELRQIVTAVADGAAAAHHAQAFLAE